MKKLVLILLALMMSGCIWGRYPRHGEIEIRDGGGEHHEERHEGHHDFEEHGH